LTFPMTCWCNALTRTLAEERMRSTPFSAVAMMLVAITFVCGTGVTQAAAASPAFYNIGALPGGNFPFSSLDGVSPDGSIALGRSGSNAPTTAGVRWSAATGLAPLGNEAGFVFTSARDASLNGNYITGYQQLGNFQYLSFRLVGGVSTDLGDLPGGSDNTLALSISQDGQTIVGLGNFAFGVDGDQGFVWTPVTGIRGIGFLPGGNISQAVGVSGNGQVIVGNSNNAARVSLAVRSTPQGLVSLGDLPGGIEDSGAYKASFDGSVIIGRSNSANGYEGFRWTAVTGMQPLGDLPGGMFVSTPQDVTDDGSTIVGYSHTGSSVSVGEEAFIWDTVNGMRNLKQVLQADYGLNLAGWTLTRANAMSADGSVIVGDGIIGGARRGWVAVIPIPEPTSFQLMVLAAGWCLRRGRAA
jgi:uncharacterized membrane protein